MEVAFSLQAIVKPDGRGGAAVVARITAKDWASF
jgi:hypothetical protein